MKSKNFKCLLVGLTSISSSVVAESRFDYTFVSASYSVFSEEIDGISEDLEGDGVEFDLMLNVAPNFSVMVGYATGQADVSGNGNTLDAEVDGFYFGGAVHMPVNERTDFFVGYQRRESTVDFELNGQFITSEDSDSDSVLLGVRAWASNQLEVRGIIDRTKADEDNDTDISLSGSFYVDTLFSIDGGYSFDSDGDSIGFGITKYL